MPYEEASHLAKRFGLAISGSSLEVLTRPYAQSCQQTVSKLQQHESQAQSEQAKSEAQAAGVLKQTSGHVMVLQIDGVHVLGRPREGVCPGLEIKSAVLYPQNRPGERWMYADTIWLCQLFKASG